MLVKNKKLQRERQLQEIKALRHCMEATPEDDDEDETKGLQNPVSKLELAFSQHCALIGAGDDEGKPLYIYYVFRICVD
jgi:hypothetical protein